MANRIPLVVIVGGGFAGLSAAKALRHAAVRILVIDPSIRLARRPSDLTVAETRRLKQVGKAVEEFLDKIG